jgi:hypothetical protein
MHTAHPDSAQARRQLWKRAFRPFFLWLPIAALLLAVDAHLRLLKSTKVFFGVSVEGHPLQTNYSAHLGSLPVSPGQQVLPGWRLFRLAANDTEPVAQRRFVWYGSNYLGEVNLTAHKGALEIVADPAPNDLQITGRWFSTTLKQSPAFLPAVPVGKYTVTARYNWSQEEKTIRVRRGQTNRLAMRPDLGSLDLAVQPAEAKFRLTSLKRPDIVVNGHAPAQLCHLPSGEYHLRLWRGDYLKESTVEIRRGETNRLTVTLAVQNELR